MSDNISRQAAIDAIDCNIVVTGRENAETVAAAIGTFVDRIKALPSTDRTGHWILTPMLPDNHRYECSNCKRHHRERYDFCPSCGADMRGGEPDD